MNKNIISHKPHHSSVLHALTRHWLLTGGALVLLAALVWLGVRMLPASERNMRSAVCFVDGRSNLCLVTRHDTLVIVSDSVHAQGVWVNKRWWWPSCNGRVLTIQQGRAYTDQGAWLVADSLPSLIANQIDSLGTLLQRKNTERKELQYYLRCHGVQDEGYQRIARYAIKQARETDSLAAIYKALKARQPKKKDEARLMRVGHYQVAWTDGEGRMQHVACEPIVTPIGQLGRPMTIRTIDHSKPWVAYAVRRAPLALAHTHKIFAVKLCPVDTTLTTLLVPGRYTGGTICDIPQLLAPNGCPVFSSHGRFIGVVSNNKVNPN